ncbi:MAG: hypothetical protein ACEPOW_01665, partial [Bacteroidales bacterium]
MLYVPVLIVLFFFCLYVIGAAIPDNRSSSFEAIYKVEIHKIWNLITDIKGQTKWRKSLKRIDVLHQEGDYMVWTEHYSNNV